MSQKNLQRGVLFSVFLLVIFTSTTHFAHAGILGAIGDAFLGAFNILLYAVLEIMSWILSAVVALFGYAVDAGNLSGPNGMLNLQATYDMWKFVRDIINIAFIFGLLFIAFAFIFQIHGYSDTKVIFKLIIAALLVNFSFPLARVMIDFANVPMYFFLQMIMGNGGSGALDNALSASRLKDILVPDLSTAIHSETSVLLLNIIFMFMFAITILVLAIQLLIRMIALVILVILSPIGFAASGIPGLKKYGGKWWDSFLNYSLFGPAAAFMLVLATNFLAAVAGGDQYNGLKQLASKTSGGDTSMIAAMGVFAIPIVMLWFTIGMAGKFSVAGASIGKDYGQKFAKWTGKKVATPVTSRYKYAKKGVQKGMQKGNLFGVKYGDAKVGIGKYKYNVGRFATGQYWDDKGAATEARWTGGISGGKKGIETEMDKMRRKRVEAKVKENKESATSWSQLVQDLDPKKDEVTRQAAALSLADNGGIQSTEIMYKAMEAVKDAKGKHDQEYFSKIIEKAKGDSFDDVSSDSYMDQYRNIRNNTEMYHQDKEGFYIDKSGKRVSDLSVAELAKPENLQKRLDAESKRVNTDALEAFQSKIKKEGEIMVRVKYDAEQLQVGGMSAADAMKASVEKHIKDLNADDLAKQGSMFGALNNTSPEGALAKEKLTEYLKQKADTDGAFYVEAMKKMKQKGRDTFYDAGIVSRPEKPKTAEEIKAKERVAESKTKQQERQARADADRARKGKPSPKS